MAKNFLQKLSLKTILAASFLIRLILLPLTFHDDVTATYWWGKFASEFGWRGFYDWLNFGGYAHPDQPMLNIYYDWLIRQIYLFLYQILWYINIHIPAFPSKVMTWYFEYGNQILLKFPMIVADLLLIFFIYQFIKTNFSRLSATIAALILCFYLPLIYNSALWGSGDSIINLLGLTSIYLLMQKRYYSGSLLFISSLLYKSSLVIWMPIVLIILIKQKIKPTVLIKITALILFFIYLISFPFVPLQTNPLIWFFQTMSTKILPGVMPQLTSNAFNLWALLFGLKPRLDEISLIGSFSARTISVAVCFLFYSIISLNLYRRFTPKNILLSLVNISLVTFCLLTRMHERYTFPALIPLLLLCFHDKKYIHLFIILSISHFLNVYNWWWFPQIPPLISFLKLDIIIRIISLINLILLVCTLYFQFCKSDERS